MHGKGIFCYNTGHYIEGTFIANTLEGSACLTYPQGSFLKGAFIKGVLCGKAIFYNIEKDSWVLQDYEAGQLKGVYYEGSGKPMAFSKIKINFTVTLARFPT